MTIREACHEWWTSKQLRTCQRIRTCRLCDTKIQIGQRYRDGGGSFAHADCVNALTEKPPVQPTKAPAPDTEEDALASWSNTKPAHVLPAPDLVEPWKREAEMWEREVMEFGHPIQPDHAHHEVRDWLNDAFEQGRRSALKRRSMDLTRMLAVLRRRAKR